MGAITKRHARFTQLPSYFSEENIHTMTKQQQQQPPSKKSKFFKLLSPKKDPVFRSTDNIEIRKRKRATNTIIAKEFRYSDPLNFSFDLNQPYYNPIVYSDLYFKYNQPLNGVLKNFGDFTQLINNSVVCAYYFEEQDYTKTQNSLKKPHLSIFEVRKTIEYTAVLKNLFIQYDFDMNIAAFRAKCFEKAERNANAFKQYRPLIKVNELDAYEQYFEAKSLDDVTSRISHGVTRKKRYFGKIWASNSDLDKITPVKHKHQQQQELLERNLNLSSLSVHELEEILLSRKRTENQSRFKVRSLEDIRLARSFPILEPLLLKEEDDIDSEKIRMRISEHKKIVRITIAYTFAFFILAIITFYIIYYA